MPAYGFPYSGSAKQQARVFPSLVLFDSRYGHERGQTGVVPGEGKAGGGERVVSLRRSHFRSSRNLYAAFSPSTVCLWAVKFPQVNVSHNE